MLGLLDGVVGVAGKVLDKFIEDKDLKTKLTAELEKEVIQLSKAQAEANIEQAKHPSLFVAGARPAIMWICAFGLAWQFVLSPLLSWTALMFDPTFVLPEIQTEGLISLVLALLGLGGMRSLEKTKGVARENMKS